MATLAQRTHDASAIGSHVACMLFRHPGDARAAVRADRRGERRPRDRRRRRRLDARRVRDDGDRVPRRVASGCASWTRPSRSCAGSGATSRSPSRASYFQVPDAVCRPRPVQQPGPPLMLGGSGNGILRRAGEWADIIHMVPVIGAAGTTTLDELPQVQRRRRCPEQLARVRGGGSEAGRASGQRPLRLDDLQLRDRPTRRAQTAELAERMGGLFGLPAGRVPAPPDRARRHARRDDRRAAPARARARPLAAGDQLLQPRAAARLRRAGPAARALGWAASEPFSAGPG